MSAISEYGFLSDCAGAALVDRACSIDWWCVPRFDSPSVFARLLDPDGGHWSIAPAAPFTSTRGYLGDSLVLRTVLRTEAGAVAVTVALADRLGDRARPQHWAEARDAVHDAVLDQAWSATAGAYSGAFGSDDLDASVLLLPLVGFLTGDDPRMLATIEAVRARLADGPLVRRWDGDTAGFLVCSFWLVECLALAGRVTDATAFFDRFLEHTNDLGLMPEEIDPATGEHLGNVPQAFSHVGLVNAAWRLTEAAGDQRSEDMQ